MTCSVLFPSQYFQPRKVDASFEEERHAAEASGLSTALVNQDRLDEGSFGRAVRAVHEEGVGIYRGWMLGGEPYRRLYGALADRGLTLINSPEQYLHCHHLPESFELIRSKSPGTVWVPLGPEGMDIDAVVEAAQAFGDHPVVIKDYVKSRKHEWNEACFVPSAANKDQLRGVVRTFLERQGEDLTGGVVLREFVELEPIGKHPKSGMPLTREHRVFVLDGEPLLVGRYWADAEYGSDDLPLGDFEEVMRSIRSRFFTMDLARGRDGEWRIIELGDGQVAGLLDTIPPSELYERLKERLLGRSDRHPLPPG